METYNLGTLHLKILDFSKKDAEVPSNFDNYEISLNCGNLFTVNLQSKTLGSLINILSQDMPQT